MFTNKMYDRLSEWTGNISVLSAGSALGPLFIKQELSFSGLLLAVLASLIGLWVSLRLSRISERRRA